MRDRFIVILLLPFLEVVLCGSVLASQAGPWTVSPGGLSEAPTLTRRCPTFSWARTAEAREIELVVEEIDRETGNRTLLFSRALPPSVTSFTPALDRCPRRGRLYAWRLRTGSGEAGRDSESRLFRIAAPAVPLEKLIEGRAGVAPAPIGPARHKEVAGPVGGGPRGGVGGMPQLVVEGGLRADDFQGDGGGVTGVIAADLVCPDCVVETALADRSLDSWGLATLGPGDLQNNTLTAADFAAATFGSSAIGLVTAADIAAGAVGVNELGGVNGVDLVPIKAVAVECDGECDDGTLGDVCAVAGSGWQPLYVSAPQGVASGSGSACGGDNDCRLLGDLNPSQSIDTVCPDGGGWDCLVFCLAP